MVTKVISRCYRFSGVNFDPSKCVLLWDDETITQLNFEESRMLELLCHNAGEVISPRMIYMSTSLPDTTYTQFQNNLYSLLAKTYRSGKKVLPVHLVEGFGYRVSLPQKTYQNPPSHHQTRAQTQSHTLTTPDTTRTEKFLGLSFLTQMSPKMMGYSLLFSTTLVMLAIGAFFLIMV